MPMPTGSSPAKGVSAWGCRGGRGEVTVDVIDFGGPEEEQDEVAAAAEPGDEEDEDHGSLCFSEERAGDHGVRGVEFPDEECDDEGEAEDKRCDVVCAAP